MINTTYREELDFYISILEDNLLITPEMYLDEVVKMLNWYFNEDIPLVDVIDYYAQLTPEEIDAELNYTNIGMHG